MGMFVIKNIKNKVCGARAAATNQLRAGTLGRPELGGSLSTRCQLLYICTLYFIVKTNVQSYRIFGNVI